MRTPVCFMAEALPFIKRRVGMARVSGFVVFGIPFVAIA